MLVKCEAVGYGGTQIYTYHCSSHESPTEKLPTVVAGICGHVFRHFEVVCKFWWHEYRFSAFWLRSKCSICSYQLNIWYDPHAGSTILNWFLDHGEVLGACSTFAADRPGIALPPGSVHENSHQIETFSS